MSKSREVPGLFISNGLGTAIGFPNANVGCVVTATASNAPALGLQKSSLPSGDHS
jgi:hypothetical protein